MKWYGKRWRKQDKEGAGRRDIKRFRGRNGRGSYNFYYLFLSISEENIQYEKCFLSAKLILKFYLAVLYIFAASRSKSVIVFYDNQTLFLLESCIFCRVTPFPSLTQSHSPGFLARSKITLRRRSPSLNYTIDGRGVVFFLSSFFIFLVSHPLAKCLDPTLSSQLQR